MYKLLIVDDNIADRKGLMELVDWKAMNITDIVPAKNGMDGYQKALEFCPSLVIADISMPIIDGLEMAKKILEKLPNTKFIFMSCYDDVEYIRSAMDYNAYGYLLKPIDLEKLKDTVERILKIKKREHELDETVLNLQKQVEKNMPYVRELVLRDIVYGNINNPSVQQLESMGLDVKNKYSLAIIQLNEAKETDININCVALNDLRKYININVPVCMRIYSFLQNRTSMVVVIYIDSTNDGIDEIEVVFDYLKVLKDYANNNLGYGTVMCVGGVTDEINNAPKLYQNAEYTLKTNIYGMENNIILAENVDDVKNVLDYDIIKLKNEINNIFAKKEFSELEIFLNRCYEENAYNKNSLKAFTYTIISLLQLVLLEENESFTNVFGENADVWNKLADYNNIPDIKQWVINIFKFAYDYIIKKNENSNKYYVLISKIKKIINEEYAVLENVNQISDRVYTSSNYANRIFKQYEGMTIFEYLIQVRIENAKAMLKNTDMKIYEISERVGYKSMRYFLSLFKEYTGMTPKNYRNSN